MRILKKVGIVILAFVLVLTITISVSLWYVFTPEKLTPLVNKKAKAYLSCTTAIEKIEPTFFSTYPFFGVKLTNLCLSENSPNSDTLFYAAKCLGSINLKSYFLKGNIAVNPILVDDVYLNFKIDSAGQSNFNILESKTDTTTTEPEEISFGNIDLNNVEFKNFRANYVDEATQAKALIQGLYAKLALEYTNDYQLFDLDVQLNRLYYATSDTMAIDVDIKNCDVKINSNAKDKNLFNADMSFLSEDMSLSMLGNNYLNALKLNTHIPFKLNISESSVDLENAKFLVSNMHEITFNGNITMLEDNIFSTHLKYSSGELDIEKIVPLIPATYAEYLEGITACGRAKLKGEIKGVVSDTLTPIVTANIHYFDGDFTYADYPSVKDIKATMQLNLDLNEYQNSEITIISGTGKIENSTFSASGKISNILEDINYNIFTKGDFLLTDFESFIPPDLNLKVQGEINGEFHTRFSQSALDNEEYYKFYLSGDFNTQNLHVLYDTIEANAPWAKVSFNMPGNSGGDKNKRLANLIIDAPNLKINMAPEMGANLENLTLSALVNNLAEGVSVPIFSCNYKLTRLSATYDTLTVNAINTDGQLNYFPTLISEKEIADIKSTLNCEKFEVAGKHADLFDAQKLFAKTNLVYDGLHEDVFRKYQPDVELRFSGANYNLSEQLRGQIPELSMTVNHDSLEIRKASLILGNSDFNLNGKLTGISKYLNNEALLKGNFELKSRNTDVYQLMDIFNGFGMVDSAVVTTDTADIGTDPFMVPKGIEISLNTLIEQSIVNDNVIENIKGGLTVKDGTLILDQMGFTNKAANMQLTAMYRSERPNHLFTAIDFHLLNIDIAELIALVPSVDTIVPMLRSFNGKGEFHLAGETYLRSDYSLKQSTIRGAAAFQGEQLILMDTETFDMIANKLMFRKKTENIVDSVSVEMTLFRDEVDLYPFLIVMDKYKAVISGRHNMDNSFNYHISVTDTPLPVRLGLNVSGTIDDLKYDLVPCKYKHLYNPEKQGALENQTLRLKKLISESLKENVKALK